MTNNIETEERKCWRDCGRTFRQIHEATWGEPGDVRMCAHRRVWIFREEERVHIDVWERLNPLTSPIRYVRAVRALRRPGTAELRWHADGTRSVRRADHVITVAAELLAGDLYPDVIEEDGTLRLDTAGHYRYRFLRNDSEHWRVYERITDGEAAS